MTVLFLFPSLPIDPKNNDGRRHTPVFGWMGVVCLGIYSEYEITVCSKNTKATVEMLHVLTVSVLPVSKFGSMFFVVKYLLLVNSAPASIFRLIMLLIPTVGTHRALTRLPQETPLYLH